MVRKCGGCLDRYTFWGPLKWIFLCVGAVDPTATLQPGAHVHLTSQAEKWEAQWQAYSPGPCSLGLDQKTALGPGGQPSPQHQGSQWGNPGGARNKKIGVTCPFGVQRTVVSQSTPSPFILPSSNPLRLSKTPAFCSPPTPHLCPPHAALSMPCPA